MILIYLYRIEHQKQEQQSKQNMQARQFLQYQNLKNSAPYFPILIELLRITEHKMM